MNGLAFVSNQSGSVRRETLAGREYLVAPVVAIRAGVLNNELVPIEEIGKYVEAWNGIPLTLGHPAINGVPVSANSPELEATVNVGRFWRAELVDDRLRGEVWVDVEKAKALGGDALEVLSRLESGEGIEVSTAYFRDLDATPGQLNGQRYYGIARNLRPNHLALLLYEIGACSWKDGCGVPRINQQQNSRVMVALYPPPEAAAALALTADGLPDGSEVIPASEIHLTLAYLGDLEQNEVGIDQGDLLRRVMEFARNTPIIRGTVAGVGRFTTAEERQPLFALYDSEYLHDLRYWLTDWLPVKRGEGFIPHLTMAYLPADAPMPNVLPQPQEIAFDRIGVAWGGQVTLFTLQGEAAEVAQNKHGFNPFAVVKKLAQALGLKPAHDNEPVINQNQKTEEGSMEKSKLIEKLAANARCPFDKAELEAMSEGALQKLERALEGGCGQQQAETPAANAVEVTAELPDELKTLSEDVKSLSQALQELGGVAGLKEALETVRANANQQKADLVATLAANERCAFSTEDLQAMTLEQLQKLNSSLRPANYAGRGGPRGNANESEPRVPEPPKVVLGDPESN